jgi:hypothetical protein
MPEQEEAVVDKAYLGKVSAARYEAQTFMSRHPEFFATPQNGKIMTDYMAEKNLILTAENFEHAFEKLKAQGKILPAREVLATMSAEQVRKLSETHGTPVYDGHGRIAGYDLPDAYNEPSPDFNRPRQGVRYTQDRLPAHPEDAQRNPSRREYAMWDSDRQKAWLVERGYWGRDLPDFLK